MITELKLIQANQDAIRELGKQVRELQQDMERVKGYLRDLQKIYGVF